MRFENRCFVVILLGTLSSLAQQPATGKIPGARTGQPVASGTLSGHVYLSDTKAPARTATVYLQPVTALQIDAPNGHGQGQTDDAVAFGVETHFDGNFSFTHVPAGDYYVIASCPGYVSPYLALSIAKGYTNQQRVAPSQQAAREAALKSIPRITVQAGQPANVDITLERGAAVSGNISYDDGTPAAGLHVQFLARMLEDGKETWAQPLVPFGGPTSTLPSTDDRGNYRISGLPAGKYIIATTFDLSESVSYFYSSGSSTNGNSNQWTTFKIYSGNTTRLKDAAIISLTLGEEYNGEDLQFPLSKLHTITGHIVSAHDGHVINSGRIDLYNSDDKSLAGSADLSVDNLGFTLYFIYDGEYILTSPQSADVDYQLLPPQVGSISPPQYNAHPQHFYGYASKPLHVDGDMDGVTIAVPESTAKGAQTF